mmetsp:Transcript_12596/g.27573  ORF Transcript_12596/g.27573 Transcript_12596/m.27573 type:complete len:154 (-) Transcript_12596:1371-1832(-)
MAFGEVSPLPPLMIANSFVHCVVVFVTFVGRVNHESAVTSRCREMRVLRRELLEVIPRVQHDSPLIRYAHKSTKQYSLDHNKYQPPPYHHHGNAKAVHTANNKPSRRESPPTSTSQTTDSHNGPDYLNASRSSCQGSQRGLSEHTQHHVKRCK